LVTQVLQELVVVAVADPAPVALLVVLAVLVLLYFLSQLQTILAQKLVRQQ
jgi:hypothetical protein